jgi:hypothetical protein
MVYPRKWAVATAAGDHLKDLDWDPMVDAANGMNIAGGVTIQYPYSFIVRNVGGVYDAISGNGVLTYGGSSDAGGVDGGDFGAVVNAALIGGNVTLVFKGKSTVSTTPILIPTNTDHVTFVAGDSTAEIDNAAGATAIITITAHASVHDLVFDGLTFSNFTGNAFLSTYAIADTYNLVIKNCNFKDIGSDATTHVIDLRATKVSILNNRIVSDGVHGGYGIYVRYASDSWIVGNYVEGTAAGIDFWRYSTDPQVNLSQRNHICFNTVKNTFSITDGYWAIDFNGGNGEVTGNIVENHKRDGIVITQSHDEPAVTVTGNTVKDCGAGTGVGIWVHGNSYTDQGYGTVISSNTVLNCRYGIILNYHHDGIISANYIDIMVYDGIQLTDGTSSCIAIGNIVINCNSANEAETAGINNAGAHNTISGGKVRGNLVHDVKIDWAADGTYLALLDASESTLGADILLLHGTNTTIDGGIGFTPPPGSGPYNSGTGTWLATEWSVDIAHLLGVEPTYVSITFTDADILDHHDFVWRCTGKNTNTFSFSGNGGAPHDLTFMWIAFR